MKIYNGRLAGRAGQIRTGPRMISSPHLKSTQEVALGSPRFSDSNKRPPRIVSGIYRFPFNDDDEDDDEDDDDDDDEGKPASKL